MKYKFKSEKGKVFMEAKTNRILAKFDEKGSFTTSDEYIAAKLIKASVPYKKEITEKEVQADVIKLIQEKEDRINELQKLNELQEIELSSLKQALEEFYLKNELTEAMVVEDTDKTTGIDSTLLVEQKEKNLEDDGANNVQQ